MKIALSTLFSILSLAICAQDKIEKKSIQTDTIIYEFVEQMPVYPDGDEGLKKFVSFHLKYPKSALEYNIEDVVHVEFVVNEDGSVSKAKIISRHYSEFDEEALRIVNKMPKWKPGKQGGKPVKVKYAIPIVFKLN